MSVQQVDDKALKTLEDELLHKIDSINGQVKKLQATLDHIEGHWKGIGAHAFDSTQNALNTRMTRLNRLLAQYLEGIAATRKSSTNNDHDVAAAFKGHGQDVGGAGGDSVGIDQSGKIASKLNQYS